MSSLFLKQPKVESNVELVGKWATARQSTDSNQVKVNSFRKPDTVLFVPRTSRSTLLTVMREKEIELGSIISITMVRLVKEAGTQIQRVIMKNNPLSDQHCRRDL